jgi:hypothetical protein
MAFLFKGKDRLMVSPFSLTIAMIQGDKLPGAAK